jgi:RNA 3'-terminal phosphate cyclase (ATP)
VDCRQGEGGGQAARTAIALSLITGHAARLRGVRADRDNSGVQWQLLLLLEALEAISFSHFSGGRKGSTELSIRPGTIRGGTYHLKSHRAVSIPLILDTLMLVCSFADGVSDLRVEGATDVQGAMTLDYFRHVGLPRCAATLCDVQRGYFPCAGGVA